MYAILISIALAIYSVILVDFTTLFQEMSVNADLIASTQALYAAESAAELSMAAAGESHAYKRNIAFADTGAVETENQRSPFLSYNEETDSRYLNRQMRLNQDPLSQDSEPRKAQGFYIRETESGNNFSEIALDYNKGDEGSDLLIDLFAFPREGSPIDLPDFEQLRKGQEGSVRRLSINTRDETQNGQTFDLGGQIFAVHPGVGTDPYKRVVRISGFRPLDSNYYLHFQTLDNRVIHTRIAAYFNTETVMLPNILQTVDVTGATPSGLFQRVKLQRQTEEALMPGLNFTVFSDGPINK